MYQAIIDQTEQVVNEITQIPKSISLKDVELRINQTMVWEYLALRRLVNWKQLNEEQARRALDNSLYVLGAYYKGVLLAMGRIVGDGAVICYIQDLIVAPGLQGMGLGSVILEHLKAYVDSLRLPKTEMMLDLMCAKGREPFYEKHGFLARPTESLGPGMIIYLNDKQ